MKVPINQEISSTHFYKGLFYNNTLNKPFHLRRRNLLCLLGPVQVPQMPYPHGDLYEAPLRTVLLLISESAFLGEHPDGSITYILLFSVLYSENLFHSGVKVLQHFIWREKRGII